MSAAISRSPWNTRIVTAFWLSSAVEKVWLFFVGIVVLRSIRRVKTPPKRLDAERQRRHVEQQDVLDLALQNAALDRSTDGHDFIRIDALVRAPCRRAA